MCVCKLQLLLSVMVTVSQSGMAVGIPGWNGVGMAFDCNGVSVVITAKSDVLIELVRWSLVTGSGGAWLVDWCGRLWLGWCLFGKWTLLDSRQSVEWEWASFKRDAILSHFVCLIVLYMYVIFAIGTAHLSPGDVIWKNVKCFSVRFVGASVDRWENGCYILLKRGVIRNRIRGSDCVLNCLIGTSLWCVLGVSMCGVKC